MTDQIRDLIDSIVDENPVQAEKTFTDIMSDKIADKIDDYRKAIANSFFNPEPVSEENYTQDTGEGEHGDGQFPSGQMNQWDDQNSAEETPAEDPPAEDPPAEETPE
jgi:hypothetical protein